MPPRKRVTKKRCDFVIGALVDLMECENFAEIAHRAEQPHARFTLDMAADIARAMRDAAPHKSVTFQPKTHP